jgi:hypothetical protein
MRGVVDGVIDPIAVIVLRQHDVVGVSPDDRCPQRPEFRTSRGDERFRSAARVREQRRLWLQIGGATAVLGPPSRRAHVDARANAPGGRPAGRAPPLARCTAPAEHTIDEIVALRGVSRRPLPLPHTHTLASQLRTRHHTPPVPPDRG